jgi:multiple antibiotic resistance protein
MLQFALTSLVTLLFVVDPVGVAPIFTGLTKAMTPEVRKSVLRRAVLIAFSVSIVFLFAGRAMLVHLGVTVTAFTISGGVLLFLTALPMLFGQRGGLQSAESNENTAHGEDVAIFPLALPLLSGPGTIATILLLTNQADGNYQRMTLLIALVAFVYLITWAVLSLSGRLLTHLGEGKVHILTRVLGIVLAALAVQYILNGITDFYHSLLR